MSDRGRILIVDDSRPDLLLLERALRKREYEVYTANNGFDAVNLARQERPDLILLDVMMPDRDGIEVCEILKARGDTASIPVIFVTARGETAEVVRAFAAGGSDHITKPFKIPEILARVSVHLRLRQAEKALQREQREATELAAKLAEMNQALSQLTRVDPLTGLLNRRAWSEAANQEQGRSQRNGSSYSVLMIDIDQFKRFNDAYGHQAGDECLRRVATGISTACRIADVVGRYGGEEFVVLAPETAMEDAIILGERVRRAIWNLSVPHATSSVASRVTASVGVATGVGGSWEETLHLADNALYRAKKSGRDAVSADHHAPPRQSGLTHHDPAHGEKTPADDNRIRVLIVDEDAACRAAFKVCLTQAGHHVLESGCAKHALELAAREELDVIVLDSVVNRDQEGGTCTRKLKADPETRDVPVILAVTRDELDEIAANPSAGADEHLVKPVRPSELLLRVRSVVGLHQERNDLLCSYELRGEQTRVLTLLLDYCQALGTAADNEAAMEHTVAVAAQVTCCRNVAIMIPDRDKKTLRVAKSVGIDPAAWPAMSLPVAGSMAGEVFVTGESRVRGSVRAEMDAEADGQWLEGTGEAQVGVPLRTTEQTFGVMVASGPEGGDPFSPRELEYIELIAKFAGSTIHGIQSRRARDEARDSIVVALARLAEHRDDDTGRHVDRVTRFAIVLATELKENPAYCERIDDEFMQCLERAVPLHDIGKVAIPDRILLKPGRLTDDEMSIMRSHAEIGARTIRSVLDRAGSANFLEMAEQIARFHHEWVDGSGYPAGLRGERIPLCARIVALADVYDALTTKRVYKDAMSHEKARAIINECDGTQFDPAVVRAFFARQEEFARLAEEMRDDPNPSEAYGYRSRGDVRDHVGPLSRRDMKSVEHSALESLKSDPLMFEQFEEFLHQLHDKVSAVETTFIDQDIDSLVAAAQELSALADPTGVTPIAHLAWKLKRSATVKNELEGLAEDVDSLAALCRTMRATTPADEASPEQKG